MITWSNAKDRQICNLFKNEKIDKVLIKILLFVNSIVNKGHTIVFDSNKSLVLSKTNPKSTIA